MAKQSTNSSYEGNAMSVFTRTSASNEGNSTSVFMTTSIEEENLDNLNSFMSSDTDDAFTSRENNDGFNGRCYANFAYASDENKTEMCDTNAKKELTLSPNQSNVHPFVNTPQQSLNWSTVGRLNSDRNRLLSPIKKISLANIPRFRRQHAINDTRVSRKQFRVNIKNDDHYHCRRKSTWPRQQKQPERSRKISDSFCICSSGASSAEFPNMCSQSKQDGNSLVLKNNLNSGSSNHSSSITLKNNKVKSCIRNEAMSDISLRTSSSSHNCAVSALSKEDLLVLWKRSEIELQTRLNSVLLQNDHLKRLLRSMYGTSHIVIEEDGSIVKNKETEL